MNSRKHLPVPVALALLALALLAPAAARADFGIQSFTTTATELDGSHDFQAGSHPFEYVVSFAMNQNVSEEPEGTLRDIVVDLPPGLLGNPLAVPKCPMASFEGQISLCPGDTQVGVARIKAVGITEAIQPIYNLTPPLGVPASFGFSLVSLNSFQEASIRSDSDYGATVSDITVPTTIEIQSITESFWGVPASAAHDPERSCVLAGKIYVGCASQAQPPVPFLTLPSACGGPLKTTLRVDSLEHPNAYQEETAESLDEGGFPAGIAGCNALEFTPEISAQPTTDLADSPSGLDFDLHQPQAPVPQQEPGQAVVCGPGTWSGNPTGFSYKWLRNGVPIPGATTHEYVREDEAGAALQCEVTATNAGGAARTASAPSVLPPAPTAPPTPATPALTLKTVGGEQSAACEPGAWGGAPTFTYSWFKNGVLVAGQTAATYLPGAAPFTVQCEVSGTNAGGSAVAFSPTAASSSPAPIAALPSPILAPTIAIAEAAQPLATAQLKDTTVTLPAAMTLNPSAANGLAACSEAAIGYQPAGGQIHFSKVPQSCPDAAKVGSLEVSSPLADHRLPGAVYVAQPFDNPFGSLLAIYLAVEDQQTGIVAKLAGKVTPDPQTGQLTAHFADNPQLPLEDVALHFFGGARGTLKTPLACGRYTTTSTLVPWSTPEGADATPSDSFQVTTAPGGGACPGSEAAAPNAPAFSAGTVSPTAGAYSPFVLKLSRPDGSQQLSGIDTMLPKGLTGKLAGVPYCTEAQIAAARGREAPNRGALEQSDPSCPAASEVGTVTVGAGAGPSPYYVQGHAYLAGPYRGAPLSLVIVTPAVAGPFDLGAVVVRTALYTDLLTAQIHAVSDPIPSILQGIPLDLRSISLKLGRPDFTLNPTSCDPSAITGSALALTGQSAPLSSRFQVGGCSALKFKPKLAISLKGRTTRGGFPALKAVLTYPKGGPYANVASAQVGLPHSEFLAQGNLDNVCTQPQLKTKTCPATSIYGRAKAWTPLLDQPLEGPVYLGVGFGHKLPDLVAELDGQIRVLLHGRVDTTPQDGLRNTFEAAPDAPVSKFVLEMKGGPKYGLLTNSENICRKTQKATANLTAQNGSLLRLRPTIANSCKKKKKGAKHGGGKK